MAGDLSIAWGKEAAARLVAGHCPQAVICANDLLAVGVLRTFRIEGVRVPEDVAVTGYDDSPFADVVEPRLTTIRQPLGALGQEAVRFIISAIESPGFSASGTAPSPGADRARIVWSNGSTGQGGS